jgi:Zn-dependent protease with chaperone function
MYIFSVMKNMLKPSNLGTWVFFGLNVASIWWMFSDATADTKTTIWIIYGASVLISLSPIGELVLGLFAGANPIVRTDMQLRVMPVLDVVHERARKKTPSLPKKINLWLIHDPAPNAFAIGRRTICLTDGAVELSDSALMGLIAHEMGHLANKHTDIQLLIGGANIFITGFLILLKIISWIVAGISTLIAIFNRSFLSGCLIGMFATLSVFSVWLWARFCTMFLMWSMRANEFVADKYAFDIGFGSELAFALDNTFASQPSNGLLRALYATHPNVHDRVGQLQQMGTAYSRY